MSNEDAEINVPLFKHIARRWKTYSNEPKYEVAIQCKMVGKAGKFLRNIKNNLVEAFGPEVKHHFLGKENENGGKATIGKENTYNQNNEEMHNPNIDRDMENLLIQDDQPDTFGKIYLEGMEQIERHREKAEEKPIAMLIIEAESQMSQCGMSGISRTSGISNDTRHTQNQRVTWSQDLGEGQERTTESVHKDNKEKIKVTIKEYQITDNEMNEWITKNHKMDTGQSITLEEAIDKIPYEKWKNMMKDIRRKRKISPENSITKTVDEKKIAMEKKNTQNNNEYSDPDLERALQQISSEDLMGNNQEEITKRVSHPINKELSHTYQTEKSQHSGESGWQ